MERGKEKDRGFRKNDRGKQPFRANTRRLNNRNDSNVSSIGGTCAKILPFRADGRTDTSSDRNMSKKYVKASAADKRELKTIENRIDQLQMKMLAREAAFLKKMRDYVRQAEKNEEKDERTIYNLLQR